MELSAQSSSDMSTLSSMEELPRELVWKIIEFAPEAVFDLRMVKDFFNDTRVILTFYCFSHLEC